MTLRTPPGLDMAALLCCAVLASRGFGVGDLDMAWLLCCVALAYYWAVCVSTMVAR